MIHTKLLIVDEFFVSIGSANLDPRSLRINEEANLNAFDAKFAHEQTRLFGSDLRRSVRVTDEGRKAPKPHEAPLQAVQTPVEPQL